MFVLSISYAEYLENWDENFGDCDSAPYGYYSFGQHVPITVQKLTEVELSEHLRALNAAHAEFEAAKERGDYDGMSAALEKSFPHELVLLI